MIDILNWVSDHWLGVFFSVWLLFCGMESLIEAWRGK